MSLCRLSGAEVPAPGARPPDHVEVWLIDSAGPGRNPNLDLVLAQAADEQCLRPNSSARRRRLLLEIRGWLPRTSRTPSPPPRPSRPPTARKFPKAAAKITDDADELLAFYDYPAGHWAHLRTTNPRVNLRHGPAPHQDH